MSLTGKGLTLKISAALAIFFLCAFFAASTARAQESATKRADLERLLEELEREANDLDANLKKTQSEAQTLANTVKGFETEIKRRELVMKRLTLIIRQADIDIREKAGRIALLTEKIGASRKALSAGLFLLYTYDQDNALTILLKNKNVSEFFDSLDALVKVQGRVKTNLFGYREDRTVLEKERQELEQFGEEQQELKAMQEVERRFLAEKRKEKDEILRLTKGKEALFQKLLQSKKKDITSLKTQLFYLERTGITAEDAVRFADLAARRAGIRTAFLLALLEVETGKQFEDGQITVGTNLGTGNWQRDLYQCYINLGKRSAAEAEKRAFFSITGSLNLDPDKMPVSRKPYYGCGGAMGPAQFLPTTWLRFEDKVAQLTGHNPPSPWNVEDAFTAAAVFLASAGADSQTEKGELAAARTYISGRPTCPARGASRQACLTYGNRIISLAKEIDRVF